MLLQGDQKADPQKRTSLGAGGREKSPLRVYTHEIQKPKWPINIWKDVGYQENTKQNKYKIASLTYQITKTKGGEFKPQNANQFQWECGETGIVIHCWLEYKWQQLLWTVIWQSLSSKVEDVHSLQPSYSASRSLLWRSLAHVHKDGLYKDAYFAACLLLHKLETTQGVIMMRTYKYIVLWSYNGILLSNENKWTRSMCTDIANSQSHIIIKAICIKLHSIYINCINMQSNTIRGRRTITFANSS